MPSLRPYHWFVVAFALLVACGDDTTAPVEPPPTPAPPVWSALDGFPPPATLYAMWAPNPGYAIAVGQRGVVLRWDGLAWAEISDETTRNLFAITGVTGGEVVAVGDHGEIVHYAQTGFVRVTSPVFDDLRGLWTPGGNDFTAVGDGGVILRGDGVAWTKDTSPVSSPLFDVWGASAGDVFAVGLDGVILHFDGTAWTSMQSGTGALLAAVNGTAHDDVYAVGEAGTVVHFDGAAWSAMSTGTAQTLQDVVASAPPLAVGSNGTVLTLNAGTWTAQAPLTHEWLYAAARAGTRAWAVGARAIYADTGDGWKTETRGAVPLLTGVTGPPGTALRVSGDAGYVAHLDGAAWRWENTGDTRALTDIWCAPNGDVFAVGTNRIVRFDGLDWIPEYTSPAIILSVSGGAAGIHATGGNGLLLRRELAGTWATVRLTPTIASALRAFAGPTTVRGYVVGDNGTLQIYNGSTWNAFASGVSADLYDVAAGPDELTSAIVVGASGTILQITPGHVTQMTSPTSATLYTIVRGIDGDFYAAGQSGVVIRFDGNAWSVVNSPTLKPLRASWYDGSTVYFVGGEASNGPVLLRYGPP